LRKNDIYKVNTWLYNNSYKKFNGGKNMKEIIINIKGMVCNGCENRVKNALENILGVESVTADHNTGVVKITSKEEVSENTLKEKIEDIGFEVV
jgi:Cu2+-exporting ATPase